MQDLTATEMLSQTTPIVCEKCGNQVFNEGTMLRRVSRILIGDSKDGILPIPVFTCSKCGHVNKEFLPKGLNDNTPSDNETKTTEEPKSNIIL